MWRFTERFIRLESRPHTTKGPELAVLGWKPATFRIQSCGWGLCWILTDDDKRLSVNNDMYLYEQAVNDETNTKWRIIVTVDLGILVYVTISTSEGLSLGMNLQVSQSTDEPALWIISHAPM